MYQKIRFDLDYGGYPVWLYVDNGILEKDLPDDLKGDKELDDKLISIQDEYDSLFIDNEKEFSYKGFPSEEKEKLFVNKCKKVYQELYEKVNNKYPIENTIDYDFSID